jgi:hypothetical protein
MTDDQVVMTDAGLIGKFVNAPRAGLFGDVVERRARQIEKDGVERLVDHVARIALQVIQIGCAAADIRLGHTSAAFPAFAVRVIAKLEADEIGILGGKRIGQNPHGVVIPGFGDREFGAAQGTRDQRGRVLQVQGLPEPLSVRIYQCHWGRPHSAGLDRAAHLMAAREVAAHYPGSARDGLGSSRVSVNCDNRSTRLWQGDFSE